jgi:D-alanyl-D-alanine carboxypeptidase (penicillin-binding protein 5/6)
LTCGGIVPSLGFPLRLPVCALLALLLAICADRGIGSSNAVEANEPPSIMAKAAAVVDEQSGSLIWGKLERERRQHASTTKILTALVALELAQTFGDLDQTITVNVDWEQISSSRMGLKPGDRLTIRDLLYGLMLPSGSDAAFALAYHYGALLGGRTNAESFALFMERINARAQELGLLDTHHLNPSGLAWDGHYSSAFDLAYLAFYARANSILVEIVGTQSYVVHGSRTFVLRNTNKLLGQLGVDGMKTGTNGPAGSCLVATAERDGRRVVIVVLGSDVDPTDTARYHDAQALLDWYFSD